LTGRGRPPKREPARPICSQCLYYKPPIAGVRGLGECCALPPCLPGRPDGPSERPRVRSDDYCHLFEDGTLFKMTSKPPEVTSGS